MERTVEYNNLLPAEILTHIFVSVDLRTLVFSCRLVCRSWKGAVECSELWRIRALLAHGNKLENNSALRLAHVRYPWYVCYSICTHVFNRNLFDCCKEISGSPLFLRDAYTPGFTWTEQLGSYTDGFPRIPQDIEAETESTSFLFVIGQCSVYHKVDLYARGLTRKIMEFQPPLHISEWYGARFFYDGIYHIEVKLFNSEWKCDTLRGHFKYEQRTEFGQWQKVSHTFTNYNPDVRYVMFHHGIDTRLPHNHGLLRLFRGAASQIMGTKLSVGIPDL